jgi:hypothetical protein
MNFVVRQHNAAKTCYFYNTCFEHGGNFLNTGVCFTLLSCLVFQEVDVGLAADVGTLQRFPKIVGNDSLVRELCYTARQMKSDEALAMGLVRY